MDDLFTATTNDPSDQDGQEMRSGGWFINRMYRLAFLEQHGEARRASSEDCTLYEQRYVRGNRLYASLAYRDRRGEVQFAWLPYLPIPCKEQLARHALNCLHARAAFEDRSRPGATPAQVVFAKQA
jgi:hypothetical protein